MADFNKPKQSQRNSRDKGRAEARTTGGNKSKQRELLDKARRLEKKIETIQNQPKRQDLMARVERAKAQVENDRLGGYDATSLAGGGLENLVDRATEDQDDGQDGQDDQDDPEEDSEDDEGGEAPGQNQDDGSESGEGDGKRGRQRNRLDDLADKGKDRLKDEALKKGEQAVAQAVKKAAAQAAGAVAKIFVGVTWEIWAILLIVILVCLLLWMLFTGTTHKGFDGSGGSLPVGMLQTKDAVLHQEVVNLKNEGRLVFAAGTEKDLEWENVDGVAVSPLDYRIFLTLKYLGGKWDHLRISVSKANGPDFTRRYEQARLGGVIVGGDRENRDSISAYSTGQAIGIDQVGTFSDELAAEEACGVTTETPVDVGLQEMVSEAEIRPIYEQLQVDYKTLYEASGVLFTGNIPGDDPAPNSYTKAAEALVLILGNLDQLQTVAGLDERTLGFFSQARENLAKAQGEVTGKSGEALQAAWEDREKTLLPTRLGLKFVSRAMQVANNIDRWKGDTTDNCIRWKWYEARMNVRQLVLDLQRMAVDPQLLPANQTFNDLLVPAQVIVYSPEDDLDNGLPNSDVYPKGPTSVNSGGMSFDVSTADGVITPADVHFLGLPEEKGVMAKLGTIFVYKKGALGVAAEIAALGLPLGGLNQMLDMWNGGGVSTLSGEGTTAVSYKNFVHIAY